ncbi:MAG: hypothetical protein AAFR67_00375 [Chloroflexota bacterium]
MPETKQTNPPTIITLTLPIPTGGGIAPEEATATLLIQRGDLAQVRQFHYHGMMADLTDAIREASEALGLIEECRPVIPELPKEKKGKNKRKAKADTPVDDGEPTIEVPLKKGTQAVKMSHIKIVSGETDAAAYRQATMLAGRLIDGKLWNGKTPIRFENVTEVAKKMKHLTIKDLSLFTLDDFVQSASEESTETEPATLL